MEDDRVQTVAPPPRRPRRPPKPKRRHVVTRFAVHALVAIPVFALVLVPALILHLLVQGLQKLHEHGYISQWFVWAMEGAEAMIIVADLILLAVFLAKTVYHTSKEL